MQMDATLEGKMCSFCGKPGSRKNRLAGGLGAMICFECIEYFHQDISSEKRVAARTRPVWDEMSDADLLQTFTLVLKSAEQNTAFAGEWVELLRQRKLSWAEIGKALGVSRQAAWERFSSTSTNRRDASA
jgi:ATP-dependent protease Clp ATPase subunit